MYTIYGKPNCTYCEQAKALLESKNLPFEYIHLDVGQPKVYGVAYISRDELLSRIPGARTMPQVLQNNELIGGFRELQQRLGGG
jgi:glutaredoxin 3